MAKRKEDGCSPCVRLPRHDQKALRHHHARSERSREPRTRNDISRCWGTRRRQLASRRSVGGARRMGELLQREVQRRLSCPTNCLQRYALSGAQLPPFLERLNVLEANVIGAHAAPLVVF